MSDDQKKAVDCLKALCELENDLTDSELKWVELFSHINDRPFSVREVEIIYNIYDRRCL